MNHTEKQKEVHGRKIEIYEVETLKKKIKKFGGGRISRYSSKEICGTRCNSYNNFSYTFRL